MMQDNTLEKKQRKNEIDMTVGNIFPKMIVFSLPLMLSGILQLLFNAADVVVVGRYAGDNSLAAVGSVTSIVFLLLNLVVGISVGVNVLSARYFGAKKFDDLSETVHTAVALSLIMGVIMAIIGFFYAKPILAIMKSPEKVIGLSTTYLRIYFLGMPGVCIYNFGSALLRSKGDTKRPLIFLTIAGIVNVGLNLLFVIKFKMDVSGVAIATIISQYISAVLVLICLMREPDSFHLHLSRLKIKKEKLTNIVKIGLPAGIQGMLFSISNMLIQSSINSFGEVVVAGNSAAQSIEGFVYTSMNAVYQAGISFTSQNMGAGKIDRVPKVCRNAMILVSFIGITLGLLAYFNGPALLRIYTKTPAAIEAGMRRLLIISVPYFICGIMDCFAGIIRGLGRSIVPMIMTLIGACLLRIIWIATVFRIPKFHTLDVVYFSYPLTWVITGVALIISYILIMKKERRILEICHEKGIKRD